MKMGRRLILFLWGLNEACFTMTESLWLLRDSDRQKFPVKRIKEARTEEAFVSHGDLARH